MLSSTEVCIGQPKLPRSAGPCHVLTEVRKTATICASDEDYAGEDQDLKERVGAIVATLSLVGAFIYAAQRIAYERFYERFGLSPEDVGLDFPANALQQTAGGIGIFSFAVAVFTGIVLAVSAVVRATGGTPVNVKTPLRIGLGVAGFYLLLVLGRTGLIRTTQLNARRVRKEACARSPLDLPGLLVTKLAIRADRARRSSVSPRI